ncbi:MAG: DUF116 domain-containing protein [Candidatus Diapherotrites archaeon]
MPKGKKETAKPWKNAPEEKRGAPAEKQGAETAGKEGAEPAGTQGTEQAEKQESPTLLRRIRVAAGELVDAGAHIDAATGAHLIGKRLGLNERLMNYTHIELRNKLLEPRFLEVQCGERMLFLPHCLRNADKCRAQYGEEGLECLGCGKCKIAKMREMAKVLGYGGCFITPGGSMVINIIKKYNPKAVVGVACNDELNMAVDKLREEGNIPAQAVMLMRSGCRNTDVNLEEVWEKLVLGSGINEQELIEMRKKIFSGTN